MPRRPRINTPNIPQHIVQRGIDREPCFFAEEDYHRDLHWLQKSAGDMHCAVHAYVLMTNHVHLLVPDMQGSGKVRDLQQAASLQTAAGQTLSTVLANYSSAGTREEQLAQIDELLAAWADSSGFGTLQSRAVVHEAANDFEWRMQA
jgi:REP element-mobilizing transposase RayT